MLKQSYLAFIQDNYINFYNSLYRTEKLKCKFFSHFEAGYHFDNPIIVENLSMHPSNILVVQAIETAFEAAASDTRVVKEASLILRCTIIEDTKLIESPWSHPSGKF